MKKFVIILVSVLFSAIAYSQSPVLIAHYPLDSTFGDATGNTTPFFIGASPQFVTEDNHTGLHLNGTEYIDIINQNTLINPDDLFIISMWINLDSIDNSSNDVENSLLSLGGHTSPGYNSLTFGTFTQQGAPQTQIYIKNVDLPDSRIKSPYQVNLNQMSSPWIHVVVMHDSLYNTNCGTMPNTQYHRDAYKFFINGFYNNNWNNVVFPSNCNSYVLQHPNWPLLTNISIGRGGNNYFKGIIDDIRIYRLFSRDSANYYLVDSLFNNPPPAISTGLMDNNYADIKTNVYPNPSQDGVFNITINEVVKDCNYTVRDISGKQIESGVLYSKNILDISRYSKGMYFFEIKEGDKTKTIKLIY